MQITEIPRNAVKNTLELMRLPLSTVERLSGQTDNKAWPPTVLFETFEASAKQVVGAFLRDNTLVEEGRIQSVKLNELRRAEELDLKAQAERDKADARLTEQHQAAERERAQAEQQARQREADVANRKREAEAKVQAEAQRAQQAVNKIDQARDERVAATDRAARLAAAKAESNALAKQNKALSSVERVAALDNAFEATKAKRKNR